MGTLLVTSAVILVCVVLTGAPQPPLCCWLTSAWSPDRKCSCTRMPVSGRSEFGPQAACLPYPGGLPREADPQKPPFRVG